MITTNKKMLINLVSGISLLSLLAQPSVAQLRGGGAGAKPASAEVVAVSTPVPTATNVSAQLKDLSKEQGSASNTGMILAAGFGVAAAVCYGKQTPDYPWCHALAAAAAGSALVASHNSGKSSANNKAACEFQSGGCAKTVADKSNPTVADINNGNSAGGGGMQGSDVLEKVRSDLAKSGVSVDYDKKELTTPDGNTIPFSAVNSAASLAAAGLSPADFGKLKDMAGKISKGAAGKAAEGVGNDGDFVIGGTSRSGSPETGLGQSAGGLGGGPKLGINRDPAQIAGLKTSLNGEPIGVAADSIFGIIDRRYQLHQKQGSFLAPQ